MKEIADFIYHLQCPSVDGIISPNGKIQLLDVRIDWGPPVKYDVRAGLESSIDELQNKGELRWSDCAILNSLQDQENEIEILSGEADYGSDGFLAVVGLTTRKLIWLAFFNSSNPFSKVKINDGYIYATSTNNCLWKFSFKNPLLCTVECQ